MLTELILIKHFQGNEFAHIQMLPYQRVISYNSDMPQFRLIDGSSVRQGRLQIKFRNRWRSVCTKLTKLARYSNNIVHFHFILLLPE